MSQNSTLIEELFVNLSPELINELYEGLQLSKRGFLSSTALVKGIATKMVLSGLEFLIQGLEDRMLLTAMAYHDLKISNNADHDRLITKCTQLFEFLMSDTNQSNKKKITNIFKKWDSAQLKKGLTILGQTCRDNDSDSVRIDRMFHALAYKGAFIVLDMMVREFLDEVLKVLEIKGNKRMSDKAVIETIIEPLLYDSQDQKDTKIVSPRNSSNSDATPPRKRGRPPMSRPAVTNTESDAEEPEDEFFSRKKENKEDEKKKPEVKKEPISKAPSTKVQPKVSPDTKSVPPKVVSKSADVVMRSRPVRPFTGGRRTHKAENSEKTETKVKKTSHYDELSHWWNPLEGLNYTRASKYPGHDKMCHINNLIFRPLNTEE